MKSLGCLFVFFFGIVFFIIYALRNFLVLFYRIFSYNRQHRQDNNDTPRTEEPPAQDNKKIFTPDEGEYVDFEEVKDK